MTAVVRTKLRLGPRRERQRKAEVATPLRIDDRGESGVAQTRRQYFQEFSGGLFAPPPRNFRASSSRDPTWLLRNTLAT